MSTLEVYAAAGARIGYSISGTNMVLEEQGPDPFGNVGDDKREAAAKEGERRFLAALLFPGLLDIKYKELKDSVHNSYLAGVDGLPLSYNAVLRLADGFKPTVYSQQQHGGDKEKGVAFASPGAEKTLTKSPQSKAVATEKNVACFSCGSTTYMVYDCNQLTQA